METVTHQGYLKHLMDADVPMVKLDLQGDPRIIPLGRLGLQAGLANAFFATAGFWAAAGFKARGNYKQSVNAKKLKVEIAR